ncbi:unnamed protein product [Psylliodes chrysocephalus]|uniref:E3 ubiquitin-protein ligase n=1 Tax=Psylliodes chrysocephalus TaxID=3402493 RepID=A0A9P0CH20_9CUCU|nr:unnamed protein product [Psylliodes chrysocephala]
MSTLSPEHVMMCPICLETMKCPIIQCLRGHSMCDVCIKNTHITMCPCCRGPLSQTRNYQLEQLIEGLKNVLKLNCIYISKGCKFAITTKDKESHEAECKFRRFQCEGNKFAKWSCNWSGNYSDIYQHFKDSHRDYTRMEYKTEATIKVNFNTDFNDVQIISFFNGQHYFYYKHKVDKAKEKCYWHFQLIGLQSQAKNFFYEFEVHNGLRKFKVTEICTNDPFDVEKTFTEEKCVVMSFTTIKNYLNEQGDLPFKFRIMSNKKAGPN